MHAKRLIVLAVSISLAVLWGCSSSMDSSGDKTVGDDLHEQIAAAGFVGADRCVDCHQGFSWSAEIVQGYLSGAHVIHSRSINAGSDAFCLDCHDPIGDGPLLEPYINQEDVPQEGLAAVTCEVCHGTGAVTDEEGGHYGIGPMPVPIPDYKVCGECHNEDFPHNNPEGINIVEDYEASRHKTARVRNENICSKCHTDEGGRLYKYVMTRESLLTNVVPVSGGNPVQCRTCHDSHNAGGLLLEEMEIEFKGDEIDVSSEYATCTTCHMPDFIAVDELMYHEDRHMRVITDSHYDDSETDALIEGYIVDRNELSGLRACLDCHNPHNVENMTIDARPDREDTFTINEQWAESAHGGHLRIVKKEVAEDYANRDPSEDRTAAQTAAMKAAGVDENLAVWADRDWDDTFGDGPGESARGDCQRCHTATGLKNYLDGPYEYALDGADNDFSYMEGWAENGWSGQNELLFCWGCHENNVGGLRNAGNELPLYDRNDVLFAVIPDVGKSTVCVACHGGRGNTDTIRNSPRSSRFQGHHAPTGGSIFNEITHTGYEFAGLNYNNPGYLHDTIGRNNDLPESGGGPCVSCHMPDENHTFAAAEYDEEGVITGVTNPSLCLNCHNKIVEFLVPLKKGQENSVLFLGDYVTNILTNYLNIDINANYDDEENVPFDAYGAFQNWKYMDGEDPCAYLHNSVYAKRLIFDSADWLDNGTLDGEITIPPSYEFARTWLYADSNGVAKRP